MLFFIIFAALVSALLQVSVLHSISLWGAIPNLFVMVGVALFFVRRRRASFWYLASGGLMLDIMAPLSPGWFTAGFIVLWALLIVYTARVEPSPVAAGVAGFLGTLLVDSVWIIKERVLILGIKEALYTAILGVVVLWVMQRVIREERIRI